MGLTDCPDTSVRNYYHSMHNSPEKCSSHLLCGGSLKWRKVKHVLYGYFPQNWGLWRRFIFYSASSDIQLIWSLKLEEKNLLEIKKSKNKVQNKHSGHHLTEERLLYDFMSVLQYHIPEVIPSWKCHINIINLSGYKTVHILKFKKSTCNKIKQIFMLYSLFYNLCEAVVLGKSQSLSRGAESYTHLARSTTLKGTRLSEKYGNTTVYSAVHRM